MKNIVIIMADQLRADFINETITPNLSNMIKGSVKFENAYCASPLCVPARGSFFTGRYPNETGCLVNPWRKPDEKHGKVKSGLNNLYTMLENDFESIHVGKQHFLTEDCIDSDTDSNTKWTYTLKEYGDMIQEKNIKKPGGARFLSLVPEQQSGKYTHMQRYSNPSTGCYDGGFENFFDGFFLEGAIKAIKEYNSDKPLLLNTMFLAPHPPLDIPEPWYSKFDKIDISENVAKWYKYQSPLQLYNLTGFIGSKYSEDDYRESWRVYAGLVNLLDYCVGEMIKALKEKGIYDDTLILFTSDHGEMLGSHCLFQKMCLYEESAKVPLIIKFPKEDGLSGKHTEVVSHIDVYPTLLSYLGVEVDKNVNGLNLMPLIKGEEELPRDAIYIQFDGNGALGNFQRGCICDGYKLIIDIFKDEYYLELYDLKNDRLETDNLVFDETNKDRVMQMLESIRKHMINTNDTLHLPDNDYINRVAKVL